MSITIMNVQPIRLLIPNGDELELVPPPSSNLVRSITRIRFDNHDAISHWPNFFVRESELDSVTSVTPELWRVYVPREVEPNGSMNDCGIIAMLNGDQSLVVRLPTPPSDLDDDTKWPAVTISFMDQYLTDTAPIPSTTIAEITRRSIARLTSGVL